jgi:drug/metabolite transporter (DMT)-like permease
MRPVLSLLFTAVFWGFVWYPLRLLEQEGLSGSWQMLVSYGAAIITLLLVRRPLFAGMAEHGFKVVILALAAGWTNVGFVLAMLDGTVARALMLFYLSPLWTILLGYLLLGERLAKVTIITLPLGLVGTLLMVWQPEVGSLWSLSKADGIAISAGFAFAVTNVYTRDLQTLGVRQKTLISWIGVILVSIITLVLLAEPLPTVPAATWIGSAALGVFGFFSATLAVIYGVTHMPVQKSAVILLAEILVGGLSAWLLANEILSIWEWLGGLLILMAGFIAAVTEDTGEHNG